MSDPLDNTPEEWRPVKGYEGFYSVSNLGRVQRHRSNPTPRILCAITDKDGYLKVHLCANGVARKQFVHRLVALAFLAKPPNKNQINHKNGVKSDNRPDNIEWCNGSENILHSFAKLGKQAARGEDHGNAKLTDEKVIEIHKLRAAGKRICEIARTLQINDETTADVVNCKSWKHLIPPVSEISQPSGEQILLGF